MSDFHGRYLHACSVSGPGARAECTEIEIEDEFSNSVIICTDHSNAMMAGISNVSYLLFVDIEDSFIVIPNLKSLSYRMTCAYLRMNTVVE